jgi:hypothetical protein
VCSSDLGDLMRFERPLRSDIMALLRALESGQAAL